MKAKRRAVEAAMDPLERDLARMAAGAKLITKPKFTRPEPSMTLGGVASSNL